MYVPQFVEPFTHYRLSGLHLAFGYCQYKYKHSCTSFCVNMHFYFFGINAQECNCWIMRQLNVNFLLLFCLCCFFKENVNKILLCVAHLQSLGSSIENYYSTRLFISKGNSSLKAKGQRWEAQWAAEQCLETGGMMFERSEFLPPQALRQAASGEVWTDWRILQQLMLMQFVNKGSTECRTRLPRFRYFFKKVQKERLEKNTSEQLRLRTAVEFYGERKRVFAPYSLPLSPLCLCCFAVKTLRQKPLCRKI